MCGLEDLKGWVNLQYRRKRLDQWGVTQDFR